MKRLSLLFLLFLTFILAFSQEKPDWVKKHPLDDLSYVGVGMAKLSEEQYTQKAKERALVDLASGIKINVSSNSLLKVVENNGDINESFMQSSSFDVNTDLSMVKVIDSWQGDGEYWVYCELNRFDYEEYVESVRRKAIEDGFGYWYKAEAYIENGDIMTGMDLLAKAWSSIEPAIFYDLRCTVEGKTINLATEIYSSILNVFNGVSIVANPKEVHVTAFQKVETPIVIGVYKDGKPIRNVELKSSFVSGSGSLSDMAPTNTDGVSVLYIQNITSKQDPQEVHVMLDVEAFEIFTKGKYSELFGNTFRVLPEASIMLSLESKQISAYVRSKQSDMDALERSVKSILTNNYFNIVNSPDVADIIVELDNKFVKGNIIPGELYNMIEYFSSLGINIVNNRTKESLLSYTINDVRSLVPENKSVTQAKAMATRDLVKKLNVSFKRKLEGLKIDTTGDIPQQDGLSDLTLPSEPQDGNVPDEDMKPIVVPVIKIVDENPNLDTEKKTSQKVQLTDGIWIEFDHLSVMGNKSRIHCKVLNDNEDDFETYMYVNNQRIINEKGEELQKMKLKVGNRESDYSLRSLIFVPGIPTELIFEVDRLQSVALLQIVMGDYEPVKLRNLK